ncbi:MAG TPA: hypothetical protein PKE40_00970 [Arachnia sp.]|nr:hypothetical protein [Arachnia sp.]HMT84898.1 hypothetical protein [Arachnia sp.]
MTNETNKSHDPIDVQLPAALTRRGVIRASAWAVPVVASVAALPLAAATVSGEVTIQFLNGDDPFGADIGDTVTLLFSIAQGGNGVSGGVSASLVGAGGIAAWSGVAGDHLAGVADDGIFFAEAEVVGHGTFTVSVSYGSTQKQFSVTFE